MKIHVDWRSLDNIILYIVHVYDSQLL